MMNIGLFTDTYFPEINGVANSAYQLKNELEIKGHSVYVFTVTNPKAETEEKNVYRIGSVPFVFLKDRRVGISLTKKWIKIVSDLKLDVIHTQTEFSIGHIGRKVSRILGIPIVHTYHTIYEEYTHYLKVPGNEKLKVMIRSLSKVLLEQADMVIVPTKKVENIVRAYGVKKDIVVQPTGIDLTKFEQIDFKFVEELKKRYDIQPTDHVLISIGRLSKEKNIEEVIRYFQKIRQTDQDAKLIIVGDGPEKENLMNLAVLLGQEKQIVFTGEVAWNKIQNYYYLGDVFVCASTSETQGLTYLEAIACRRTLLVHKDECLEELLIEGVNGYSFDTEEGFLKAYDKLFFQDNRLDMGEKACKIARNMSLDNFGNGIEKVYQQAILKEKMSRKVRRPYGKNRQMVG